MVQENIYTRDQAYAIANGIWLALGSQRFSVATGCEPLVYGEKDGMVYLMMTAGKGSVNRIEVSYDGDTGLYWVRFIRRCGDEAKVSASYKGVSMGMLYTLLMRHTGLQVDFKTAA